MRPGGEVGGAAVLNVIDEDAPPGTLGALIEPIDPGLGPLQVGRLRRDREHGVKALDGHETDDARERIVALEENRLLKS